MNEEIEKAQDIFGFNPETIGLRHRGWWIIDTPDEDDLRAGAEKGYLCIKTRDGAANPIDVNAMKKINFINTIEDGFDSTYRYYYYKPLNKQDFL